MSVRWTLIRNFIRNIKWFILTKSASFFAHIITVECLGLQIFKHISLKWNEWCFRPQLSKTWLGLEQPGLMRWVLLWIMPQVQDWSIDLLTSNPWCYYCTTDAPPITPTPMFDSKETDSVWHKRNITVSRFPCNIAGSDHSICRQITWLIETYTAGGNYRNVQLCQDLTTRDGKIQIQLSVYNPEWASVAQW